MSRETLQGVGCTQGVVGGQGLQGGGIPGMVGRHSREGGVHSAHHSLLSHTRVLFTVIPSSLSHGCYSLLFPEEERGRAGGEEEDSAQRGVPKGPAPCVTRCLSNL